MRYHWISLVFCPLQAVATLPRLPLKIAQSWPGTFANNLRAGDIRAEVLVPSSIQNGVMDVQVFWRLRAPVNNNPNPWTTALVTDGDGKVVTSTTKVQTGACGVISFDVRPGSKYYIYPLPHYESGADASLHFKWLDGAAPTLDPSACETVMESASFVRALESRDSFHGFSEMEQVALPSEIEVLKERHPEILMLFPEPRNRIVRLLHSDSIQADWALGPRTHFNASAQMGEYFTFQIGLYAKEQTVISSIEFSSLVGQSGSTLAAATSFTCFNLEGINKNGKPMQKTYALLGGHGGVLWVGLDLPAAGAAGKYTSSMKLHHSAGTSTLSFELTLQGGAPAVRDTDIYKLERLRWLNSVTGFDTSIPHPYTGLSTTEAKDGFTVQLVNKQISVGKSGFLSAVKTIAKKNRKGKEVDEVYSVLTSPINMKLIKDSSELTFAPQVFHVESAIDRVTWNAVSEASGVVMNVSGSTEFDSYSDFKVVLTATAPLDLDDIQLHVPVRDTIAKWMVGMGADPARSYEDLAWKWNNESARNSVWLGRAEAGLMIRLNGDGDEWLSPMFNKDDAVIPFIPQSWGGVGGVNEKYGANITKHCLVTQSGARHLAAGESVTFLFDIIATPARPANLTMHYRNRQIQIGYGAATNYETPQQVAGRGATVLTLHQGIPGEVNGTMVNPYINYPFTPKEVDLMTNISDQAWNLGLNMKYYYTIRELSNHVAELYPLLSLEGEVFLDQDPYTIAQKGYCHDADCHGGDVYLHEHVITNYTSCWQQGLAGGEIDAALCDKGESRWFNYYVEGLRWSVARPPFLTGIYYDGINFDRASMQRIRRAADSAASIVQERPGAKFLLDLHTGRGGGTGYQPCISYLTHYAYVDSLWNGEGFSFGSYSPDAWLIEASGFPMGLSGDTLGGASFPYQAMLFAMTDRNSNWASAVWKMWDHVEISNMVMMGWWEEDAPVHASSSAASAPTMVTSYVQYGRKSLLSICTWSPSQVSIALNINWDLLGLSAAAVTATALDVEGLQNETSVNISAVSIAAKKGLFVLLERKPEIQFV